MAIDSTPDVHDITHYAGDTLTLAITVPAGFADGYTWKAVLKANRETGTPVDATFDIVLPVVPGDPGFVTLTAAECTRLARMGTVQKSKRRGVHSQVMAYNGEYDIQLSPPLPALDPVTTIVQGGLTLELDVTTDA